MGPEGLKEVAQNSRNAAEASKKIIQKHIGTNKGLKILNSLSFNEFSLLYTQDNERKIDKLQEHAQKQNILLGTKISAPEESGFKGALTLAFTERFKKADADYFKETGKHININSAYRSRQHQAALSGKHPVVAKPGHSQHGLGRAIDVQPGSAEFEWLKKNGAKYGWDWKKIKNDPCHFGFCGTPKQTTDGKTQPAATTPQEPKETITPDKKKTIKDLKDKTTGTSSTENKST
jgi:LAS superfamily LD-carboxypeptidase LdcB